MRPILPCSICDTSEFVWAEPYNYGEGGRYIAYTAVCERCGERVSSSTYQNFETKDHAMEAWNKVMRGRNETP